MFSNKQVGSKYSDTFKVYITKDDKIISPFHDIPCFNNDGTINCVNEIPRFDHGKFEISKNERFNPIKQDLSKGKLRFINNIFPCFGYPFNYGAIPQTWEDPTEKDEKCNAFGDNDPIDVIEIGSRRKTIGFIYKAKILGALALIDGDEADWKIIAIDILDPISDKINDLEDVGKHCPSLLEEIFRWLRDYKIPTGKPANSFANDGKYLSASLAKDIVAKTHESWKRLIKNGYKDICIENLTISDCQAKSSEPMNLVGQAEPDAELPDSVYEYSYII